MLPTGPVGEAIPIVLYTRNHFNAHFFHLLWILSLDCGNLKLSDSTRLKLIDKNEILCPRLGYNSINLQIFTFAE